MRWQKKKKATPRSPKTKKYKGNSVEGEDGWESIWYGESGWTMSIKAGDEWQNIKLAATGHVEHKANYHFGWNGERFSMSKDWTTLETYQPELALRVLRAIRNWTSFHNAMNKAVAP